MKKILLYAGVAFFIIPTTAKAQFESVKDSVVQLYGIVMTADSLQGIPGVTIAVKDRHQGTYSNYQGLFSIAVLKGDKIEFTSIGYKPKTVLIPDTLKGNQYNLLQLI